MLEISEQEIEAAARQGVLRARTRFDKEQKKIQSLERKIEKAYIRRVRKPATKPSKISALKSQYRTVLYQNAKSKVKELLSNGIQYITSRKENLAFPKPSIYTKAKAKYEDYTLRLSNYLFLNKDELAGNPTKSLYDKIRSKFSDFSKSTKPNLPKPSESPRINTPAKPSELSDLIPDDYGENISMETKIEAYDSFNKRMHNDDKAIKYFHEKFIEKHPFNESEDKIERMNKWHEEKEKMIRQTYSCYKEHIETRRDYQELARYSKTPVLPYNLLTKKP